MTLVSDLKEAQDIIAYHALAQPPGRMLGTFWKKIHGNAHGNYPVVGSILVEQ